MTKLVGILNYNDNSFSDGGQLQDLESASRRVFELLEEGADIVDIGVTATSYEVQILSEDEEWAKLGPLLKRCKDYCSKISIDTFYYNNARRAIEQGVCMINDVSGGKDVRMLELIAANPEINYVLMKSLCIPADKNIRVTNIAEIYNWAVQKIQECLAVGIAKTQLIFDPGIGFATNPIQSLQVIAKIGEYKALGVPVYVGHSRKSFFDSIACYAPAQRDIETVAASIYMLLQDVDYLRVHNVQMHKRAFNVVESLIRNKAL